MLTRVVKNAQGQYVPYTTWKAAEEQRLAELQRQQRMPQTQKETCDFSDRIPGAAERFDFSFKAPKSDKLTWDFTF